MVTRKVMSVVACRRQNNSNKLPDGASGRAERAGPMNMDRVSAKPASAAYATAAKAGAPPAPGGAAAFEALLEEKPVAPAQGMASTAALAASIYDAAEQAVVADREARRHGRAMLLALAGLQRATLIGQPACGAEPAPHAALAALARHAPPAHDPVLRLILREIGVRAAVELARAPAFANVSVA